MHTVIRTVLHYPRGWYSIARVRSTPIRPPFAPPHVIEKIEFQIGVCRHPAQMSAGLTPTSVLGDAEHLVHDRCLHQHRIHVLCTDHTPVVLQLAVVCGSVLAPPVLSRTVCRELVGET